MASSSPAPALPPHPTFIRPAIDVPVIVLGAAIFLGTEYATKELKWAGCGDCDRAALGSLDRRVLGNADRTAARASDVLLASAIALPFLLDLGDALAGSRRRPGGTRHAAGGWLRDAIVLAEVFTVNLGLTNIVKFAVRRPRPYSYDRDSELADPTENDARLSFYSGHASTAFAMLTAYAMLFTFRHPRPRAAVPVWIAAVGLAATTGVLRVVAGKHFWSDVVTGAFAGAAVGALVPALHSTRWRRITPALSWAPRGALVTLAGRF